MPERLLWDDLQDDAPATPAPLFTGIHEPLNAVVATLAPPVLVCKGCGNPCRSIDSAGNCVGCIARSSCSACGQPISGLIIFEGDRCRTCYVAAHPEAAAKGKRGKK